MNLTLLAAIVLVGTWAALVFGAHLGGGPVQLLYAAAAILFPRRIIAGAPVRRRRPVGGRPGGPRGGTPRARRWVHATAPVCARPRIRANNGAKSGGGAHSTRWIA